VVGRGGPGAVPLAFGLWLGKDGLVLLGPDVMLSVQCRTMAQLAGRELGHNLVASPGCLMV
jgi:hypothetical protein